MSDDLDRRLRESLSEIELPAAPATLRAAMNQLEAEPVAPRTRARRLIPTAVTPALVVAVPPRTALLIWLAAPPCSSAAAHRHIGLAKLPASQRESGDEQQAQPAPGPPADAGRQERATARAPSGLSRTRHARRSTR